MIELGYELDAEKYTPEEREELKTAYYLDLGFWGNQTFLINGINLGSGAQSTVNFVATLAAVVRAFDGGEKEATYIDWDSSWRLFFQSEEDQLKIWDNADRGPVTVPYLEFREAVLEYVPRVREEFYKLFPELRENERFTWLMDGMCLWKSTTDLEGR